MMSLQTQECIILQGCLFPALDLKICNISACFYSENKTPVAFSVITGHAVSACKLKQIILLYKTNDYEIVDFIQPELKC